jgi:hypothetical protein
MHLQVKFSFHVAFDQRGPGQGQPVFAKLEQLIGFAEQTLKLFAPFL